MNRLAISIAITVLVLTVFFFSGKWFFLHDLESEITDDSLKSQKAEEELNTLQKKYDNLKAQIAKEPVHTALGVLAVGGEGALMRRIFDAASRSESIIKELELLKSFHIKGKQDESAPSQQGLRTGDQLPQFDERTGMAVGAQTDEGETEWAGVEIIPTRLQIKGTFRGIVAFFNILRKGAPLFQVQSTDLTLEESGILKGWAILVFPVFEPTVASDSSTSDDGPK